MMVVQKELWSTLDFETATRIKIWRAFYCRLYQWQRIMISTTITIMICFVDWSLETPCFCTWSLIKSFRIVLTCVDYIILRRTVVHMIMLIKWFKLCYSTSISHGSTYLWWWCQGGGCWLIFVTSYLIKVVCDVIKNKLLSIHYGWRASVWVVCLSDMLMVMVLVLMTMAVSFWTIMSMLMKYRLLWSLRDILQVRVVLNIFYCYWRLMSSLDPFLFRGHILPIVWRLYILIWASFFNHRFFLSYSFDHTFYFSSFS